MMQGKWQVSLVIIALLLFTDIATPVIANDVSTASTAVWDRHVERASTGNIDAVMEDFTEDSVIITSTGVIKGKVAIRSFYEKFLVNLTPEMNATAVINGRVVHDNIVVFNLTVSAINRTFHDTAVIKDNKIMVLSTLDYPAK